MINTALESFLPKTESRANAVYLFEELELRPGTRLQAAGRYEVDRISGTAAQFPDNFLPVDGRTRSNTPAPAASRRRASASAPCRTCPTTSWRA